MGGWGWFCLSVVQGHMMISGQEYDRKLITSNSLAPEDLYNVIYEGTIDACSESSTKAAFMSKATVY